MLFPNPQNHSLSQELQACNSHSRRNGKVARLPAELRDKINRSIEDGVPYKKIIEQLGESGRHLNEDNLSNWRLGGYEDYLKARLISDRARAQSEAAANVVRELGNKDPQLLQQVCQELSLLHYFDTLVKHGSDIAKDSLTKNPAKMITFINSACKMSNTSIMLEKQKWREELRQAKQTLPKATSDRGPGD
jgi:hypothetical protein